MTPDPFAAAKAKMRELATAYGAGLYSLDMHGLMEGLSGVELKFMQMGWRDGAFDPEHNVILINSQTRTERQRFTLAHEIGHALLLGDDDLLSDIHDAYEGDKLEQVIETLCNVAAASILVPQGVLSEMTERYGYTGETLARLARRAEVSASVALYALSEVTPYPTIYAVCARGKVGREAGESGAGENDKVLSVRANSATPDVKYKLADGTPIPADHPIHAAYETDMEHSEESYVPFRSGRKMKAHVVAYPMKGRVAASFRLTPKKAQDAKESE